MQIPSDALPGRGGVRVELMSSLAGDQSALREWFHYYPYSCLEQRASKAIGLRDEAMWKSVAASAGNYLDRDGLARYFPTDSLEGSDVLTSYLIQIANADSREWPEDTLRTHAGRASRISSPAASCAAVALPTADLTIRKLAAIEALARHDRARCPRCSMPSRSIRRGGPRPRSSTGSASCSASKASAIAKRRRSWRFRSCAAA